MKTDWYATQLLLANFRGSGAPALPATWYIAASTEAFDPALTGETIVEAAGDGYARVGVVRASTHWSVVTKVDEVMRLANSQRILWPAATELWTPIVSIYLCDALVDGNAFYGDDLLDPIVVPIGQALSLGPGKAVFSER